MHFLLLLSLAVVAIVEVVVVVTGTESVVVKNLDLDW